MNKQLINFYTKQGKTPAGVKFTDILSYTPAEFEQYHDFIQWLFPTKTRSRFNPDAPELDNETAEHLIKSKVFNDRFKIALFRYLSDILGMHIDGGNTVKIAVYGGKAWQTPTDHNLLRLTRVIESCALLGHFDFAEELYGALLLFSMTTSGKFISNVTVAYWQSALHTKF